MTQLALFAAPSPAVAPFSADIAAPAQPPATLASMARDVLERHARNSAAVPSCRHCHCTDEHPCTLAGDTCVLNHRTRYCSAHGCQKAARVAARSSGKAA